MKITKSSIETRKGEAEWFTGNVYIDVVAEPEPPFRAEHLIVILNPAPGPPCTPIQTGRPSS